MINITKTSIITNGGNNTQELLTNIKQKACGPVASNIHSQNYAVYSAAIEKYQNHCTETKIETMLRDSLTPLLPKKRALLQIVMPERSSARSKTISQALIKNILFKHDYAELSYSFIHNNASISNQLQNLSDNSEHDTIIFGGIDSLINKETISELSKSNWLMSAKNSTGFALGEAAAFIKLDKNPIKNGSTIKVIGNIEEIAANENITTILLSLDGKPNSLIEWKKIAQKIWPSKTNSIPKIISTQILGELGAATIPVSLALATELPGKTLIYQANGDSQKNAILVENTSESNNA
ncbi:MAG: hypothetical protein KAT71_05055 [Gammaproteobacteria bacterium]|nr:hypothetical protein [Gammaproteobacteria bacterium]